MTVTSTSSSRSWVCTREYLISPILSTQLGGGLDREAGGAELAAVLVFEEELHAGVVAPGRGVVRRLLAPHVLGVPVRAVVQQQGHLVEWVGLVGGVGGVGRGCSWNSIIISKFQIFVSSSQC